jgi:hypothetical protein
MSIKEYKHLASAFCLLVRCNHDIDPPRRVGSRADGQFISCVRFGCPFIQKLMYYYWPVSMTKEMLFKNCIH